MLKFHQLQEEIVQRIAGRLLMLPVEAAKEVEVDSRRLGLSPSQYARTDFVNALKGVSTLPSNFFGFMAFMSINLVSGSPWPTELAPQIDLWTVSTSCRLAAPKSSITWSLAKRSVLRKSTFVLSLPSSRLKICNCSKECASCFAPDPT